MWRGRADVCIIVGMHALTFHGPRDIRYREVPDPGLEAPTDVIVKVSQAGLCGSDLHPYRGDERGLDDGCVMGHECIGAVVEAGAAVTGFKPGDRVFSPFTTSCGRCFYCQRGLSSRCERGQLLGWVQDGVGLHGAQAEYIRVPLADSTLLEIPDSLSDDQALLLGDVLPTGYYCAERALAGCAQQPGGVAAGVYAVIGLGPVGLMAVWSARALGAEQVYAIDLVPERLAMAARLGAIPLRLAGAGSAGGAGDGDARSAEAIAAELRALSGGRGVDAVMEVVGRPESAALAYELVRPGGAISIVGVHTAPSFPFSPAQSYDKNLSLHIGRCPARSLSERMIALLSQRAVASAGGGVDPAEIITHRVALADGVAAYQRFEQRQDGCIKLVFAP
ncbi:MAG: alcohol dehydrogenase family protein [Haliangiales bacterium]